MCNFDNTRVCVLEFLGFIIPVLCSLHLANVIKSRTNEVHYFFFGQICSNFVWLRDQLLPVLLDIC